MTSQYDFILAIGSNFHLLLITVGALLFIPALIEVGSLKLAEEKDRKIVLVFGLALFFLGCLIGFYPNTVGVSGHVTLDNGTNYANGAVVTINGISRAVTNNGWFCFDNIPKNTSFMEYRFHGVTHKEEINIPFWMAFLDYNANYDFKFGKIQIQGKIINSTGNLDPLRLSITPLECKGGNTYDCNSDNNGIFKLSVPCENPIKVVVNKVISKEATIPIRCKIIKFSDEDIQRGYKQVDINIGNTISVEGKIMSCRDGLDEKPAPVIGAAIYMGDRANITDDSGRYLLKDIPRSEKLYSVKLVSGTWNNGTIIPPLKDTSEDDTETIRNIYIHSMS